MEDRVTDTDKMLFTSAPTLHLNTQVQSYSKPDSDIPDQVKVTGHSLHYNYDRRFRPNRQELPPPGLHVAELQMHATTPDQ
ncbi:hypothetical protein ACTXT7_002233 [Hymenolepis weldensis]